MSDRLISADKLIEFYKECGEYSIPANVIIQNIKDAPIACNIEVMCKQIEMIVDRSGYNVDSENNITDEYISQNAVLNIVRHGGVVMQKKETPTVVAENATSEKGGAK
jgi:hypothetical protein